MGSHDILCFLARATPPPRANLLNPDSEILKPVGLFSGSPAGPSRWDEAAEEEEGREEEVAGEGGVPSDISSESAELSPVADSSDAEEELASASELEEAEEEEEEEAASFCKPIPGLN